MRKRNITLFILLLVMGLGWGIAYWLWIAPNASL